MRNLLGIGKCQIDPDKTMRIGRTIYRTTTATKEEEEVIFGGKVTWTWSNLNAPQ